VGFLRPGPLLVALSAAFAPLACGRSGCVVDRAGFVHFGDITYIRHYEPTSLETSDLGPEFDRVRFKLAGNVPGCGYRPKEGDAAYLDPGTPVYTVAGYRPQFVLAVVERRYPHSEERAVIPYVAATIPGAVRGSDLLDIAGKVAAVRFSSAYGGSEIARIDDPRAVDEFGGTVLAAPVKAKHEELPRESRVGIVFELQDGIRIGTVYSRDTGELRSGIVLPQSARVAVEQAIP
jgi:hypothetical protein